MTTDDRTEAAGGKPINAELVELLRSLDDDTVYFVPNAGNAGDALIAYGTFALFDELGLHVELCQPDAALSSKTVLLGGGGNLVEGMYETMAKALENFLPGNRCILLPHTIVGNAEILNHTHDNLTIFCREEVSYRACLAEGANVENVKLAHDMAFHIPAADLAPFNAPGAATASVFRTDGETSQLHPLPEDNRDISLSWNGDLWHNRALTEHVTLSLAAYVAQFEAVRTDRLHIGILGALLGKRVTLHANNYYKNRAVYEWSLAERFPNVEFVKPPEVLLETEQS